MEVVDARISRAEEQIHLLMDLFEAGDEPRLSSFLDGVTVDETRFIVLGLASYLHDQERSNEMLRKLAQQDAHGWRAQKERAERAEETVNALRGQVADQAAMIARMKQRKAAA